MAGTHRLANDDVGVAGQDDDQHGVRVDLYLHDRAVSDAGATLHVELVLDDRTDRQHVRAANAAVGWSVTSAPSLDSHRTLHR